MSPVQWSEDIDGVIKTLPTDEGVLALTLDACGSKNDSLDEDLIEFFTIALYGIPNIPLPIPQEQP